MTQPINRVFIATSIDGFIADKNGKIEWLHSIPNPEQIDMGYSAFISEIDAIVMGRNSYETVLGFDIDWPYSVPVFVASSKLKEVPEKLKDSVFLIKGTTIEIITEINRLGYNRLYVDGGRTISQFLQDDLIDEMIITVIPILLGNGTPLFIEIDKSLEFKCVESKTFLGCVAQNHYKRDRT